MKKHASFIMCVALLVLSGCSQTDNAIYVSPEGSDDAAGTRKEPLATLTGARHRVRAVKPSGQPVNVIFTPGIYRFKEAVTFAKEDSGSPNAPVIYRAAQNGSVRFTGGRAITGWQPVKDETILETLLPEARGNVVVADLQAQGVEDYGRLTVRGFGHGSQPAEAELFFADHPMTLARWPNEGFRGIQRKISQETLEIDSGRLARWVNEKDPWIFAYWHHDWAELYEPIVAVDPETKVIERSRKIKPTYGITPNRARWYALNLLCELDQPGEYYIDRKTGRLYFWPPPGQGAAVLSQAKMLIQAENLSHVTFRGFIFECCRSTAIKISGGADCRVVQCTLRNIGQRAISVNGGARHEVYGCDVFHCGEGGISMRGGDRRTLTPAGHNAENNHVHHYSRRARTYKTGISVDGVGNRIVHNLVHDGPHVALSAGGNDHVVEYNEVHNVVCESGDAGAYYVGRDWTQRGTVLRYNYWHDIVGATGHGGMTIYLDDQHCGNTIHGNLFERCARAVFIGGGDDNIVTNNVFIDCWKAAHIDNRGMGWQKKATDDPGGQLRSRLRAMPYQGDLWRKRYPELTGILEDEPNIPKRNVFRNNISAGGSWDDIYAGIRTYQTVENNLVFDDDREWITLVKDRRGQPIRLEFRDSVAVSAIGFQPLPLNKMGLYADPRRATWPVERSVQPITLPHDRE